PRFLGIVISSFFLLFLGLFMSIFGGMFLGFFFAGVNPEEYVRHIPTIISLPSIASGLVKCFVFGLVLATVCTQKGYFTTGGAKGVGRSVVSTAVITMISIVVTDWFTSFIGEIIIHVVRGF
ncbi:MAG: ABC transporter permease, partial [Pseudobdellovibrionaceae bacterium]